MGFAETFKALSDPARREILTLLKDGRLSAGEIGAHFDMTGATISYHLSILKKSGLIFEQKEKNYIYYTLNTSVVEEVLLWVFSCGIVCLTRLPRILTSTVHRTDTAVKDLLSSVFMYSACLCTCSVP